MKQRFQEEHAAHQAALTAADEAFGSACSPCYRKLRADAADLLPMVLWVCPQNGMGIATFRCLTRPRSCSMPHACLFASRACRCLPHAAVPRSHTARVLGCRFTGFRSDALQPALEELDKLVIAGDGPRPGSTRPPSRPDSRSSARHRPTSASSTAASPRYGRRAGSDGARRHRSSLSRGGDAVMRSRPGSAASRDSRGSGACTVFVALAFLPSCNSCVFPDAVAPCSRPPRVVRLEPIPSLGWCHTSWSRP